VNEAAIDPTGPKTATEGAPLLKIANIETLYFDRIYALHGLTLTVREKEIFAVLGPNGAGKTTLLRTIAGLLKDQPNKGTIEFMGRPIHRRAPEFVANLGIVYVPEDRGLFRELTVKENLDLGCWGRKGKSVKQDLEFVYDLFPILKERSAQQAETLSGGQQQMLAVARALLRRPKLLMLDEPSLGLAPLVARDVYDALVKISRTGTTILLVEQNANWPSASRTMGTSWRRAASYWRAPPRRCRAMKTSRSSIWALAARRRHPKVGVCTKKGEHGDAARSAQFSGPVLQTGRTPWRQSGPAPQGLWHLESAHLAAVRPARARSGRGPDIPRHRSR
jgi:branched-chain amino acid transport system ATP-binding protein